jgi:fatty-acyl-CoA synthase
MRSTMQDAPLLVSTILRHGQTVHPDGLVVTVEADGYRSATHTELAASSEKLAKALVSLGVTPGDRVATLSTNNDAHLAAYLAVPSMGAVLHTLNARLFPEQLSYIVNHAEDRVIIADAVLLPVLRTILSDAKTVEHVIVIGDGDGDTSGLGTVHAFDELVGAFEPGFDWPTLDEREAAAMCYTSGTTGWPKGVVYSQRSIFLHSFAQAGAASISLEEQDRVLVIVPMFHANAWGIPYSAWMVGAAQILPQIFVSGEQLLRIVEEQQVTRACGVPTIWNDFLRAYSQRPSADVSSLRTVLSGGSAAPRSLFERFRDEVGVELIQGWGMTETSPLGALARPPANCPPELDLNYRTKAGRVVPGVEVRVVGSDDTVLPADGSTVGEFEIRGPWVTASYYKEESPERFHDGWLRTGDVGTLDRLGFMTITDRTKDLVKSGGEWISSVDLEGQVMAHPDVFEAAVIAVPDARWEERPLVIVVAKPGTSPTPAELQAFLATRVARIALPEHWAFVDSLPKTSVGKFDKKVLRALFAEGKLDVVTLVPPPRD